MPTAPAVRQYAGDLRFWQIDSSTGEKVPVIPDASDPTGNQPVECDALSFSYTAGDEVKVISKRRDSHYNQPVFSDTQPGTTDMSVTLLELPPLMLARILFGDGSTSTVSSGSVTDAALAVPTKDVPLQLPHRLIKSSPAPVVKNGGTTLVSGTDYDMDLRRGQIRIKAAAVTVDDPDVTISYSYDAHVATTILGGATPTKQFYIDVDMQNRVGLEDGTLRIPQVSMSVDGDVDWLSADPIQAVMKGTAVIAAGEDAPYTFTAYKAAA